MERPNSSQGQSDWWTHTDEQNGLLGWRPEQGLSELEEEMVFSWLGLPEGKRETLRQLGERFGVSKSTAARTAKRASIKLAILYLENKKP